MQFLLYYGVPLQLKTSHAHLMCSVKNGFFSKTFVTELYSINKSDDFDYCFGLRKSLPLPIAHLARQISHYAFFVYSLTRFDIFHFFFDGGMLRLTPLKNVEFLLLKLFGKKIVLMPYGSDTFVYDEINDLNTRHALLSEYKSLAKHADAIKSRIRYYSNLSDIVVPAISHIQHLPKWDVLPVLWYPAPQIKTVKEICTTNQNDTSIKIVHAPNHRGIKGTEFLVEAVSQLKSEGFDIQLVLLEGVPNDEVLQAIQQADIVVDQLIIGYALFAIEAMSAGKIVISNLENDCDVFRRYSYLNECPIVSANPETIYRVLKALIGEREKWPELSKSSQEYVAKRHSEQSVLALWQAIYAKIWHDKDIDLHNFYHPLDEKGKL